MKAKWIDDMKTCHYESKEDFFWVYVMEGCGCGSYSSNVEDAWSLFTAFHERSDSRWDMYKEPGNRHLEILAHWMDSLGLIEHGSSIPGSWLSDEGEELWNALHSEKFTPYHGYDVNGNDVYNPPKP